jgi:hypothetical protein
MRELILKAIDAKRLVEFEYQGYTRVCEPHVCGCIHGVDEALMYQVAGGSRSGRLPNWRRVKLGQIAGLRILDRGFAGPRPYPSGGHSSWDSTYGIVG